MKFGIRGFLTKCNSVAVGFVNIGAIKERSILKLDFHISVYRSIIVNDDQQDATL